MSKLIKAAQAGEEVVIANRGEPVVQLVPISGSSSKRAGSAEGLLEWIKAHRPPPRSRRTAAEIDADIDRERSSWD